MTTFAPEKLNVIQKEIGEWSARNFGSRRISKVDGQVQGSLQPLEGVGEEIGELFGAEDDDDRDDAIADFGVYLLDYCNLEGFSLADLVAEKEPVKTLIPLNFIVVWYGKLLHCTLKRHQGIRGFDNLEKYTQHRNEAVSKMLLYMLCYCDQQNVNFMKELNKTWERVKRRDWQKNKDNAHEVAQKQWGNMPVDGKLQVMEEITDEKSMETVKDLIQSRGN